MSIRRLPRVGFTLELQPRWRARAKLADMLQQHLSRRFGRVYLLEIFLLPVSVLYFKFCGRYFAVGIKRLKPADDWKVRIDPLESPARQRNMSDKELRDLARDLMLICGEIHGLLIGNPSITRLGWYFEGWSVNIPAVRTPAQLPWHVDIPKLGGAQDLELR